MIYLLKSREKNGNRARNILILSVFVLLSIFAFIFPNFSRGVFQTLGKPVWLIRDQMVDWADDVKGFFSLKSSLVAQVENLQSQVDTLSLKTVDYDTVLKENQDLKAVLGRNVTANRVISRVLSRPPQSPYDTLVIDAGSGDGIKPGNKVYISDSVIVGNITNVTPHTSLVEMFSSGDKKTEAQQDRTGTSYELVGMGGANFSIEVPKEADILWGDVFSYPGLLQSVLGSVYYIDTNSQSAFKTIFIRISGNVFQSKWVFVDTK